MLSAKAIAEGIDALPTLPEAVARLTILLQNERSTIDDFERAVHSDPAVTANLLRAANSVFYHSDEPITTAGDAIRRIGLDRVCEVAVAASYRRALPARISGYGINAAEFWMHSAATAVFAEALSKKMLLPSSAIAFTAGLLHDVGKLVVGGFIALLTPESNWWEFGTAQEERKLLGSNHCDVGQEIAFKWNLPIQIGHACRWHHEPHETDGWDIADLAAVVHGADYLAYRAGFPGSGGSGEALDPHVQQRLQLTPETAECLATGLKDEILKMGNLAVHTA